MLDPHRTFAAGTLPGEPRDEPRNVNRAEPRPAPFDVVATEERLMRALRTRVQRVGIERAPASLRERVRAMLDVRA